MTPRRSFRRMHRRRRRPGPETYTLINCRNQVNVHQDATCGPNAPMLIQADTVFIPTPAVGTTDPTTAGAVIGEKSKVVMGIKFQSEFIHDSLEDLEDVTCPTTWFQFGLTIWEALVCLPLAAGSKTLPAYLPNLTTSSQAFDVADRVLWKRLSLLHIYSTGNNGPNIVSTWGSNAGGPQVVKSKFRLGEHQGLFYVKQYVHDVAFGPNDLEACIITIWNDSWWKVFFRTSFR